MTHEQLVVMAKRIANGIGSPYGEGASYHGASDEGPSHLDEEGYMKLVSDITNIAHRVRADWLRSEIEKLEGSIKTGNNGEGLPFENSPEIFGNARMEAWKNGYNQALTSIITRYKEELLELESK